MNPLPSQTTPTPPSLDDVSDLSHAFESDQALMRPLWSSFDAHPSPSTPTLELQAGMEKKKQEAKRQKEPSNERQQQAKKP